MRTVGVFDTPLFEPGVCAKCGSQDKEWFVDLGFNATGFTPHPLQETETGEYVYPPIWFDGVLMLCCDCMNSLIVDARRSFVQYALNHEYVKVILDGAFPDSDGDSDSKSDGAEQVPNVPGEGPTADDPASKSDELASVGASGSLFFPDGTWTGPIT